MPLCRFLIAFIWNGYLEAKGLPLGGDLPSPLPRDP